MQWPRDRVVWLGALVAMACAYAVFFAGPYLPYIDYANHVGLISILARGGETGADAFLARSWAPTPYWLYYVLTALLGRITEVDVASKLVLGASGATWVLGGAHLAEATGRDPRIALAASLGMFGIGLGYGFASFVFTCPLCLFVLGSTERLLGAEARLRRARVLELGAALTLVFLGHPLVFLVTTLAVASRLIVELLVKLLLREGGSFPLLWSLTQAFLLPGALALFSLRSAGEVQFQPGKSALLSYSPWAEHLQRFGGSLLERGSAEHWTVMRGLGIFAGLGLVLGFVRPRQSSAGLRARAALWLYAAYFAAWYWVGPMSITDSLWYVYPRFAVLFGVMILLLPRVELSGKLGAALACLALPLVVYNASLNFQHVRQFNDWARPYDEVRKLIPKGAKVLPLTVVPGGDLANNHQALTSLYFYHLVDGAAFVPFLFDTPGVPVRYRKDVTLPRAPPWNNPDAYDPRVHGVDYDYLVLRGPGLIQRTQAAGLHELVQDVSGWAVFRTKPLLRAHD